MTASSFTLLWQGEHSRKSLYQVAQSIYPHLEKHPYFCLWLEGEIGAGKTTLSGYLLQAFGLDARIPVTSPTYTYINQYEIKGRKFAHIDLYRAGPGFSPAELFHLDEQGYSGLLVEWPEVVAEESQIAATHRLLISYLPSSTHRSYRLVAVAAKA